MLEAAAIGKFYDNEPMRLDAPKSRTIRSDGDWRGVARFDPVWRGASSRDGFSCPSPLKIRFIRGAEGVKKHRKGASDE
jgi:hypothetical protein